MKSAFNTLKTITKSQQSLFNTSRVTVPLSSSFNVRKTRVQPQRSEFDVYVKVSASVTMEWNVGQPVQFGIRLAGRDRWIPMYPGGF